MPGCRPCRTHTCRGRRSGRRRARHPWWASRTRRYSSCGAGTRALRSLPNAATERRPSPGRGSRPASRGRSAAGPAARAVRTDRAWAARRRRRPSPSSGRPGRPRPRGSTSRGPGSRSPTRRSRSCSTSRADSGCRRRRRSWWVRGSAASCRRRRPVVPAPPSRTARRARGRVRSVSSIDLRQSFASPRRPATTAGMMPPGAIAAPERARPPGRTPPADRPRAMGRRRPGRGAATGRSPLRSYRPGSMMWAADVPACMSQVPARV